MEIPKPLEVPKRLNKWLEVDCGGHGKLLISVSERVDKNYAIQVCILRDGNMIYKNYIPEFFDDMKEAYSDVQES